MRQGRIAAINVSDGGVPKRSVAEAQIGPEGVAGDRQDDQRHHGGPDRAVSLYAAEVIAALSSEGHPIRPGSAGENLTVSGLAWGEIAPGTELSIGPVKLLVTGYAAPCEKIGGSFAGGAFERISQKVRPGWSRVYARVLEGGLVRVGDVVQSIAGAPTANPPGVGRAGDPAGRAR